jgi:endo-1,4-beta-xylanase
MQRKSQRIEGERTRREFLTGAAALGAVAAIPARLSGLGIERTAPVEAAGAGSLRAHAAARGLMYGTAVNPALLDLEGATAGNSTDPYTRLVAEQANILVPENSMKWGALRPTADRFDFTQGDRLLRFAGVEGQRVRGHNLCWHQSVPAWVTGTASKDNARAILTHHIQVVAGHYRGKLHSWDVVNEAIYPSDGLPDGLRKTLWLDLIGPDYLELAFRTAAAADPEAKLTYNDYGIELDTPQDVKKREMVLGLLKRFKTKGVPIHAVGVQSHLDATGSQPGQGLKEFIREAAKMDLEVYVTEMDVNTHAVVGGQEAQDRAVAAVFGNYMRLVLAEPNVPMTLTWGITSAHTWLNDAHTDQRRRPDGTRERPLPFDDRMMPTPAFLALGEAIDRSRPSRSGNA